VAWSSIRKDLITNASVCIGCGHHHRHRQRRTRIRLMAVRGAFPCRWTVILGTADPLAFKRRDAAMRSDPDSRAAPADELAVVPVDFCRRMTGPWHWGDGFSASMGGSMGIGGVGREA